jgi:hypothetical protein
MNATAVHAPHDTAQALAQFAANPLRFQRAVDGLDPAEILSPADRTRLMLLLVEHWRWSDRQIASHTKWSLYTVARIREQLMLAPCSGENPTVTPPERTH